MDAAITTALANVQTEWNAWVYFSAIKGWMVQVRASDGWACMVNGQGLIDPSYVHERLCASLDEARALRLEVGNGPLAHVLRAH
jgi:hypothetical protein